ncbi:MAG: hypothetical protein WBP42_02515 [Candidatus Zixiibacteriota bacterium]
MMMITNSNFSKLQIQIIKVSLSIVVIVIISAVLMTAIIFKTNERRRDQAESQLIAESDRLTDSLRSVLESGRPAFAWHDKAGNYWCEKVRNPIQITKREYDSLVLAWDRLRGAE